MSATDIAVLMLVGGGVCAALVATLLENWVAVFWIAAVAVFVIVVLL